MKASASPLYLLVLLAPAAPAQSLLDELRGTNPGDQMGFAVLGGLDFDQDGYDDVVVGSPYDDTGGKTDNGTVKFLSGADGSVLRTKVGDASDDHFGWSLAIAGDVDQDGRRDVVVGAPNADQGGLRTGMARVISGQDFTNLFSFYGDIEGEEFGYAVTGRLDWDGDGVHDVAIGAPDGDTLPGQFAVDPGYVEIYSGATGLSLQALTGTVSDARLGEAIVAADVNGDGVRDLAIGSPAFQRVTVADGVTHLNFYTWLGTQGFGSALDARSVDGDAFAEVFVGVPGDDTAGTDAGAVQMYDGATGLVAEVWRGEAAGEQFGTALAVLNDLDGDGLPDLAVGAPEAGGGEVRAYSTATTAELFRVTGEDGSALGRAVDRAGDFNADGFEDLVVGAPLAEDGLDLDTGLVRVHSASGPGFVTYCTAGVSANGCMAALHAAGTPSATAPSGFFINAITMEGDKKGIFFYSANGRQAVPWGNGTSFQCVVPPVHRGMVLDGNGTDGLCDGFQNDDLNARWCPTCPKPHHNLGAGAVGQVQLWYRDPDSTSNQQTSLSNAVEFVVAP